MRLAAILVGLCACKFSPRDVPADGDGDASDSDAVVVDAPIDAPETRKCKIALGSDHSCLLRTDTHEVFCWGSDGWGALGNGAAGSTFTLQQVTLASPSALANKFFHTCAIVDASTSPGVACWGQNDRGQIDMGPAQADNPVTIAGLSDVVELATGRSMTCARRADKSITCWGHNAEGQLGDGTTTPQTAPATAVKLSKEPTQLALGGGHACVVQIDGTVACWGTNEFGQIGGVDPTYPTPTEAALGGKAIQVVAGGYDLGNGIRGGQTCALLEDHSIQCQGSNEFGQLGNGTTTASNTPVTVNGISKATKLAMGRYHTCALLEDGNVKCWGRNEQGQIGDNTQTDRSSPKIAMLPAEKAVDISVGGYHSCALMESGALWCWGGNAAGQLGVNMASPVAKPVESHMTCKS